MAFLGSLGKSLGLDSEFGKGLIGGVATSLDKGFQDDMKRTKDNVDNLVLESYKGGVEEKKRFEKELKDNEKIIDRIAANLGGDQGVNHPKAYEATYSLISQEGIDNAFDMSKTYKNAHLAYGVSPITSMGMKERTNGKTPLTASIIARSITTPMVLPDMKKLGESANVGIMKANFLGPAYKASDEISERAGALLMARGVDINKGPLDRDLPPALKANLDPLILGMQSNPKAELARLQIFMNKLDKNDPDYNKKEAQVKQMIDTTITNIKETENLLKTPIKGLSTGAIRSNTKDFEMHLARFYFGQDKLKFGMTGEYVGVEAQKKQKTILNKFANYYVRKLNEAATKGNVKDNELGTVTLTIKNAILQNKKVIVGDDGSVTMAEGEDSNLISKDDLTILGKKQEKQPDPLDKNKKTSTISIEGKSNAEIKTMYDNAKNSIEKNKIAMALRKKIQAMPQSEQIDINAEVKKILEG